MEIIGNIAKQKEDIDKVLKDTKELQKEINNLTGQLDRSFTVADELIFQVKKFFLLLWIEHFEIYMYICLYTVYSSGIAQYHVLMTNSTQPL